MSLLSTFNPPLSLGEPFVAATLPDEGEAAWRLWCKAILAEAERATRCISARRWRVIHPDDEATRNLLSSWDDASHSEEIERPRVLSWRSRLDGRTYLLVEFLNLVRAPEPV